MTCRLVGSAFCIASTLFAIATTYSPSLAQTTEFVYIMRHTDKAGESADSAEVADFSCHREKGLEKSAGEVRAKRLRRRLADADFQEAFSSTLCRTAHTAFLVSGLEPSQTMVEPSDPQGVADMLIGNLRDAGGNILVVLHSRWIEKLTRDRSFKGRIWPADQCYGEVRKYRAEARRLVLVETIDDEIERLNGDCKK